MEAFSPLVQNVTWFLSAGVVATDILLVAFLFLVIFAPKTGIAKKVFKIISDYGLIIGMAMSLGAMASSLFYSQFANFAPCDLCWWQRVFIYPQFFLFATAYYRKVRKGIADETVYIYSAVLSTIGAIIAAYQTFAQSFAVDLLPCKAAAVSCSKIYFMTFGYVSIPSMSLTAFLVLLAIIISRKMAHSK